MATLTQRYSYVYAPFIKESYVADEAIFRTVFAKTWFIFLLVILFVAPLFLGNFELRFLGGLGVAILSTMGLNILTGYTGLISLGQSAFMGVGAYACAVMIAKLHFPFYVAILGGGCLSALIGVLIGIPALRIKGLYLAIATLAFQFIANYTFVKWQAATGGAAGLSIPSPKLGPWELTTDLDFYYIVLVFLIGGLWMAKNLFRSKYGRALMAIRDNDVSAEVAGIPVFRYKILSFVISSFYAGVAGALFGIWLRHTAPDYFGLDKSIQYLAMVIIGGRGTILGSVFGATFLVFIPEFLNWAVEVLSRLATNPQDVIVFLSPIKLLALGFLIMFFIQVEPSGLAGIWRRIRDYLRIWPLPYI
jgi:branched-chain amino acid transport system permease protein